MVTYQKRPQQLQYVEKGRIDIKRAEALGTFGIYYDALGNRTRDPSYAGASAGGVAAFEASQQEKAAIEERNLAGRFAAQEAAPDSITQPTIDLTKQRAPIDLTTTAQEKTGISALREEDSIIGTAVRIATDWRTTVALVGTLATIGTLGLAAGAVGARAGAAVVPKAIIQVGKRVNVDAIGKAAGLTSKQTAALATQVGRERINVIARYAVNPKSKALTTSILTKAGMAVGAAAIVGTVVGTYPFANFELAEATDKIGIAIFKAAEAGDEEEVARLQEYLEEMVNPSVWDSIVNKIPFLNVLNNVKKNVAAAQVSAKSILQSTQKKLEAARVKAEEPTFAEQRKQVDIEAQERKREFAAEEEKRFEKIEEEREERKEEEKKADKIFFDEIEARRKATKEEERAEDDAYWRAIYEANEKRKAEERAADEEYWRRIKEENIKEPWTAEDKKVIDDWNAGKSALNFKWLGL